MVATTIQDDVRAHADHAEGDEPHDRQLFGRAAGPESEQAAEVVKTARAEGTEESGKGLGQRWNLRVKLGPDGAGLNDGGVVFETPGEELWNR